jgi:DHA1 family tetracycline resistance protein-like MFS transporter
MQRLLRSPIFLVACVVFIDFAGFGLVIPILPFWAQRLGANSFGVGLVLTVYALAQFIFTPLLGTLSDRHGRRRVILISLVIEALSFALTALAGSLPLLLIARTVGGAGASNIGSAQAVVADVTPPERRARGMGAIGAAIGLGFVVGPAIGGLLATAGPTVPFWAAAVVALLNAALVARFLPETRSRWEHAQRSRQRGAGAVFAGWRHAAEHPAIARLVAVNLLFTVAFSGMETVFPLFTQHVFAWTSRQAETGNGYIFTYVGVVVVLMQGGLVGRLARRFGERRLLLGGLALLAAGLALLPLGTAFAPLLLAIGLVAVGDGAISPSASALLSFATPPDTQGATLGLSQGVGGLGRVVGPLVAGATFALGAGVPFVIGAALALVALLVAAPRLPVPGSATSGRTVPTARARDAAPATGAPGR